MQIGWNSSEGMFEVPTQPWTGAKAAWSCWPGVFSGVFPGSASKELQIRRIGALAGDFGAINLWSSIPVHRDEVLWGTGTPKSVRTPESEVTLYTGCTFQLGWCKNICTNMLEAG